MREAQPVPKHTVIDPAALRCEFDYQCRMGESCSGVIELVDRNITVCQYDVTKVDRLCIFHADCLQGQQCRRSASGAFVCTPSIEAALGTVSCVYDYECSGGKKCMNIAGPKKAKNLARFPALKIFRCRQSQTNDPRHDQLCNSNAECPYQQVSKLLIVIDCRNYTVLVYLFRCKCGTRAKLSLCKFYFTNSFIEKSKLWFQND
ncbi:unnamed protein product [Angiostrongylus costaricensis]|uniref:EB domain-containing protein n=1 Tax=Angiostrongylus costaricensis TaxID=334426 RepID=A0A0R3PYR2_ANGCS|nr:unnamed protein product [Angiostrongylus costaricensis]